MTALATGPPIAQEPPKRTRFIDPAKDPRNIGVNVPDSSEVPSLDAEVRDNAKKMAEWTLGHIENSFANRQHLERLWIRVMSYMAGFHFFEVTTTGMWRSKPVKDGEIRATVPLMRSIQRRELGRLTENILTVKGLPTTTRNPRAAFNARRGELMVNAWQEEIDFADTFEDFCNDMIHFGVAGLHSYIDHDRQQVFSESWSAWEMHPIPWNATKDSELYGLARVKNMTKSWIEEHFGAKAAAKAGRDASTLQLGSMTSGNAMGRAVSGSNELEGRVCWVWLLPTKEVPTGQHYALVEDEMFAYQRHDEKGNPIINGGKLPVLLVRYSKQQNNWYGMGALPTVLGAQFEADRAMSKQVQGMVLNNGLLFINDELIDMNQMTGDFLPIIPYDTSAYGADGKLFESVPPTPQTREVGATIQLSIDQGRMAVGHESEILFGRAEGRVESGPLGRILNVNAQAPLAPTMRRIEKVLAQHFHDVLDKISEVWPDQKRIRVIGQFDLVNELILEKQGRPTSKDVMLRPFPMLPAGRLETYNQLLNMRQMIGDDKKPLISADEFKRGLMAIGMSPPGMELTSDEDDRIQQRVARLFGDGKKPGPFTTSEIEKRLLRAENIEKLRDELVKRILDPGFLEVASPEVQAAFVKALEFVTEIRLGDPLANSGFDANDDADDFDARKQEEFFDAAEQQNDTLSGQFQGVDGVPVGLQEGSTS